MVLDIHYNFLVVSSVITRRKLRLILWKVTICVTEWKVSEFHYMHLPSVYIYICNCCILLNLNIFSFDDFPGN